MKRLLLILIIIEIFGCAEKERDYAIHLSVCNDFPECTEVVVDSTTGINALKCDQNAPPFAIPCFKDSTIDSITFRFSIRQNSFVKLELMDNSERVIKTFINATLLPGYYTCSWCNKRDGGIYGCRLLTNENEISYWFIAE